MTENDPSTLVEGVSVISGDLYTFEEDLVVPGKEPLRFRRSFISSIGNINPFPHLVAVLQVVGNRYVVTEPNGTSISYQASKKNKQKGLLRYEAAPFYESAPGVSNTSSGQISAQTNLKNQSLLVEPDGKRFTVYTSGGTRRYYRSFKNQKKVDIPFHGKGYLLYYYRLECEELPNGNKIRYEWNKNNELERISTISPKAHTYASANLPKWDPTKPIRELTIHGSFGKKLSCRYGLIGSGISAVQSIVSSDQPEQTFLHEVVADGVSKKRVDLRSLSLPSKRTLQIDYDEKRRVKTLFSRVGIDDQLIATHSFFYHPNERKSHVLDAQGNKTAYLWNEDFRLVSIEKFIGENEFYSGENFVWEGCKLQSKTFVDRTRMPVYSRTFKYDLSGNVEEEIGFDGIRRVFKYAYDTKHNLILEVDELGNETQYVPTAFGQLAETHLPSGGILRQSYDSAGNEILRVDGENFETKTSYNAYGKPLVVVHPDGASEEYVYFPDGLLKTHIDPIGIRTSYEYDYLRRVVRKKVADAEEIFEYVGNYLVAKTDGNLAKTTFKYDSLNRLIEKTDPLAATEVTEYVLCAAGNKKIVQKTHTDAGGLKTIETFDARKRVVKVEKWYGKTISIEERFYNKNDALNVQVNTIFSPDGSSRKATTQWEYNARGQLKTLIEAGTKITTKSYTPRGELAQTTKPDGISLHYTYNDLGFLTSLTSSDRTVHHEMRYNRLGHLLAFDGIERVVNAKGKIISELSKGLGIENRYDDISRRIECRIPEADCLIEYEYDPVHIKRVARKTTLGELLYAHSYISYDLAGNLLDAKLINGQPCSYLIDLLSRKTGISTLNFNQQILDYDRVARQTLCADPRLAGQYRCALAI